MWGPGTKEFAADLIIDPFTQAQTGKVLITGSMYADVTIRFPSVFAFTAANAVGP